MGAFVSYSTNPLRHWSVLDETHTFESVYQIGRVSLVFSMRLIVHAWGPWTFPGDVLVASRSISLECQGEQLFLLLRWSTRIPILLVLVFLSDVSFDFHIGWSQSSNLTNAKYSFNGWVSSVDRCIAMRSKFNVKSPWIESIISL